MKYELDSAVCTTIGRKRGMNQDNFYLDGQILMDTGCQKLILKKTANDGIFSVCDGMGGEADGDVASRIVAEELKKSASGGDMDEACVSRAVDTANTKICAHIKSMGRTCGSTFVAALINGGSASIFNIGDSRCYLIREGRIYQLTKDHTLARQMVLSGMMTEEQAKNDPRRHQLTQHLGIFPEEMTLSMYRDVIDIRDGDKLLLCSDGLTDGLEDGAILDIAARNDSVDSRVNDLVEEAMNAGSTDNVTAMLIDISKEIREGMSGALWTLIYICSGLAGIIAALLCLFLF